MCTERGIYIGGWGGESAAAPTGKSFRFVRACERAGARAARDQLCIPRGFCETNVFVFVVVSPRRAFFKKSILAAVFQKVIFDLVKDKLFLWKNIRFFHFFVFFAFSHKDSH